MLLLFILACTGEFPDSGVDTGRAVDSGPQDSDTEQEESGHTGDSDSGVPALTLRLGIPNQTEPGSEVWEGFVTGAEATGGFVVLNPDSGPGSVLDADWLAAVEAARARGVRVLGYVPTTLGTRDAESVDGDVNQYTTWYDVDGIWFDEVPADCGSLAPWYAERARAADALVSGGDAFVVLNPGKISCEDYLEAADVLVVAYDRLPQITDFVAPTWMAGHGRERFMFVAYDAPGSDLGQTLKFVHDAGIGWTVVTDDRPRDPFDALPTYWESEVAAVTEFVE